MKKFWIYKFKERCCLTDTKGKAIDYFKGCEVWVFKVVDSRSDRIVLIDQLSRIIYWNIQDAKNYLEYSKVESREGFIKTLNEITSSL